MTWDYDHRMSSPGTRMHLPRWAQDALLAGFVTMAQIQGTLQVAPQHELVNLDQPYYAGYGLLVITGLLLLVRRRWPVSVFVLTGVGSLLYYGGGYPDGPAWLALFVALYTMTAYGDGHRSLRWAAGGLAALTAGWLLKAELQPLLDAGWVFFRIGGAVLAATLGELVRMNRVRAAEAQQRAERAEQSRDEEARRRVDAERLRIAREVHDTVAHAIAIVNVQAGMTAHVLDKRPERAREALLVIEQTSARALRELRATLGVLRDVDGDPLADAGLGQVDELAGMVRDAGLGVKVEAGALPPELPTALDRAAYRILQESVTNAIRHAGPATVTLRASHRDGMIEIEVTDDGAGPGADWRDGGGHGIAGMRERCELLGGELTAEPGATGGFRVWARLPVPPDGAVRR